MPLIGLALFFYQSRGGSDSNRIMIIRGALRMIRENPFALIREGYKNVKKVDVF
jgi:hypothetical protein